jgi:hypothetical protein
MKASSLAALVALAGSLGGCASDPALTRGDILIDGKGVHPESVTSANDGSLYVGSITGSIYRAGPRDVIAVPFIKPSGENGLRAVFGVLADSKSNLLWVCSVANPFERPPGPAIPSELVAFELGSGKLIGRWAFPAPGGTCNDISIAKDGSAYASDTPGGRILKLARGGSALEVVASDDRLKGIDGLAFGADGALYINNVQRNEMWRVNFPAGPGSKAELTQLKVSEKMGGPDGLRHIGNNRFLQAEGTSGRATLVTIKGDNATIQVLRDGLNSSPGITLIGHTVYVVEGKIQYLFNPELRGKDPGPFKAIAIALPR